MKRAGLSGLELVWVRTVSLYSLQSTVPVVDTGNESLALLKFHTMLLLISNFMSIFFLFHKVCEIK